MGKFKNFLRSSVASRGSQETALSHRHHGLFALEPRVMFDGAAAEWFIVDDTGEAIRGKVIRIGAAVDAVSQTVKVYYNFEERQKSVLPGMSGVVLLPRLGS